jgi:hypothetical protein
MSIEPPAMTALYRSAPIEARWCSAVPRPRRTCVLDANACSWLHRAPDVGTAQLRRPGNATARDDVLRARPRDHGWQPQRRPDHRDRCGQGARRRVPRHLPHTRQPRSGDPAPDHRAHRAHRRGRTHGAPHRVGARLAHGLPRRLGVRRPQRGVRPRVRPRCSRPRRSPRVPPRRSSTPPRSPAACCATRSPTASCRRSPRGCDSITPPPTGRSTTRWPPPTCSTCCSNARPGSGCSGSTT